MANDREEELIDLNKLTQRELLIILARDVKDLKVNVDTLQEEQQKMSLKVNTIETKSKVWGGIAGLFTALAGVILERLINR